MQISEKSITFAQNFRIMAWQRLHIVCIAAFFAACLCAQNESEIPRDSVPEDHLAWLGFRGAVKEVHEYDYGGYGKTVYRFDPQGRLLEYIAYANPFFGSGGCVFGVFDHYRYAYQPDGKIIFLETYNADNTVVDAYADLILELFPPQNKEADLFPQAKKEYGDTTFCYSKWTAEDKSEHYFGRCFDRRGNWIETVSADLAEEMQENVRVREITYYRDIEVMGLSVGVKTVTHKWKADDKNWSNRYDFDREGNLIRFQSWCEKEALFDWSPDTSEEPGSDLITWEPDNNNQRKITYWK